MVATVGRPAREQLDLPLRVLLALAAGLGLAFLLDYLDRSVRDRSDLEEAGAADPGRNPPRQVRAPSPRRAQLARTIHKASEEMKY